MSGLSLGIFLTPATLPTCPTTEIIDWNLEVIQKAEDLIARAVADTQCIMLGPGVEAFLWK